MVYSLARQKELFAAMLRIRMIEEAIADAYKHQQMRCPTHLSIGQEAIAVAVCEQLHSKDKVFSSHRAHAHYLAKGGNLNALIAELYGKETGCTAGRGGSMHLTDLEAGFVASTAIVANSIPLAVGNALHQRVKDKSEITVAFFGEGATEEGAFYESLNFAALKQLPVLFVCENNRYSVYSPLEVRQPTSRSITELVKAIGVDAWELDGNDVNAMASELNGIVTQVREQGRPAFIECHTYRHREHCGPNFDDSLDYRPEYEVQEWLQRDPLKLVRHSLEQQGVTQDYFNDLTHCFKNEIEQSFFLAKAASFPDPNNNTKYLYGE